MSKPSIFVTVDVEEIFDWNVFDRDQLTVPKTLALGPFQEICLKHNIQPIYFVTYPIMCNENLVREIKEFLDKGQCQVGLHIHGWANPPYLSQYDLFSSYQGNLPYELEAAKLWNAAEKFREVFGFAPKCHRAGRFGCGPNTFHILSELGVSLDFSPSAAFNFSDQSGADFSELELDAFTDEESGTHCFPVTGINFVSGPDWVTSLLHKFNLFKKLPSFVSKKAVRLTPEGNGFERLKVITDLTAESGSEYFVFTFHVTSLFAEGNQYAESQPSVEGMLQTTDKYLQYFFDHLNGQQASVGTVTDSIFISKKFSSELGRIANATERNKQVAPHPLSDFQPLVSAIIPTYNRVGDVQGAIESVLDQTYRNVEIVVVDDGSTDNTEITLKDRYGDRIKYVRQKNAGVAAARNRGVQIAKGELIAFLDSDDRWHSDKVGAQVEAFAQCPDLKMCWTDAVVISGGINQPGDRFLRAYHGRAYSYQPEKEIFSEVKLLSWKSRRNLEQHKLAHKDDRLALLKIGDLSSRLYLGNFMLTPTIMMPRSTFIDVGGFNSTTFDVGEDYDLNARVCQLGLVGLVDFPLCSIQSEGEDHLRHRSLSMARANLQTMEDLERAKKNCLDLKNGIIKQRKRDAYAWLGMWEVEEGNASVGRRYLLSSLFFTVDVNYRNIAMLILSIMPMAAQNLAKKLWRLVK